MSTFWQNRRHARVRTLLSSYIDGEVSASEARRVAAHLSGCDECVAELESLRATTMLLGRLPSLDTPRSYALTAADVLDMSPRRGLPSFAALSGGLATAGAAAVVVVLVVGVVFLARLGFTGSAAAPAPAQFAAAPAPAAPAAVAQAPAAPAARAAAPASAAPAAAMPAAAAPQTRAVTAAPAMAAAAPAAPAAQATSAPARCCYDDGSGGSGCHCCAGSTPTDSCRSCCRAGSRTNCEAKGRKRRDRNQGSGIAGGN